MPQMNYLNLPAVHNAAQTSKINEQTRQLNEAKLEVVDEERQLANTRFIAGASKVLMDLHDQGEMDQFEAAVDELGSELVRRGITSADDWAKNRPNMNIDSVRERYAQALTGLAGRPVVPPTKGAGSIPAKIQQYEYYMGNVAGDPEAEAIWDQATQVDKGFKTVKVPMADGTEMMVNFDPQSGQGYDLQTGQPLIVRPGGGGESLVYGEEGLIGAGQPAQAPQQTPPGFGRTEDPASQARRTKEAEVAVTEEIKREKIVDQQLTALESSFRLQPMMEAAEQGANAWNTGWGSMLAFVPGSSAKDLESLNTTIKANIGFDRLQRMRAESPTGGALGQVAVQELVALQATIANLDTAQSTEQYKSMMRIVLQQYSSWTRAWGEAIMKEGTDDQRRKYYNMIPAGSQYIAPDGTWKVKRQQ